jgi:DNA mismatch repair protein MutS2
LVRKLIVGWGMDEHTLHVLGFFKVLDLLTEGAQSPQGADVCRSLRPARDAASALLALRELEELARAEPVLGPPPLAGIQRVESFLEQARVPGTALDIEALLAVRDTVAGCQRLLDYLEDAASEGPLLGGYAGRMTPLLELIDRFERTFGPRGEVLDAASPRLAVLRSEMKRVREKVLKILGAVLRSHDLEPAVQDEFITNRQGRYVIPLRTDFRGYIQGIVHDRSRTGATFFVEPLETVELNNHLIDLKDEEQEEIRRILVELTRTVGSEAARILENLAVAAHVDALSARLRLARRMRAVQPELLPEPMLDLRGARHPLLALPAGAAVVPIDLRLGGATRLLLITGANAGGKTVALKTAGLLVAMAQAGFFIPAEEGSRIGWFDELFADIGDEQDIERNLSTFSAHIAHLRDILERADRDCLVLLDELGTGTDPTEGGALAMAMLEELLGSGASIVATTHLTGLKGFVFSREGGQNAAVAFDPATGKPLYRLEYGRTGSSNAFDVAERLGFPKQVLDRARAFALPGSDAAAEILQGIDRARAEALRAAQEAEALRAQWEARLAEQKALLEEVRRERDAARTEARRESRELLERLRGELASVIRAFAQREGTQQQAEEALRRAEEELSASFRAELPENRVRGLEAAAAVPGANVLVSSLEKEGVIEAVDPGSERAAVRVGGLRVTVPLRELSPAHRPQRAGTRRSETSVRVVADRGAPEVLVVGFSVEDALARVDKALDDALLRGAAGFRIIHGRGTGTLRKAIRKHLSADPHVSSVRSDEGDEAATWVELA